MFRKIIDEYYIILIKQGNSNWNNKQTITKGEKNKMNIGKNIRKFRRNMGAISPVIATLLMIAIAVVASLVTYAWVMGYMSFQTEKTGQGIQVQSIVYNGNATIANDATDNFTVYVQNVGDSDVKITSIYINGVLATATLPNSGNILKQETATLTAQTPGSTAQLSDGVQQVTIKVVAQSGTFAEVTKQFTIQ